MLIQYLCSNLTPDSFLNNGNAHFPRYWAFILCVYWAGIHTDIQAAANTDWAEKVKISPIPRCMSFSIHGLKTLLSLSLFIYFLPTLTPKSKPHLWMNFSWTYPKMYKQKIEVGDSYFLSCSPKFPPPVIMWNLHCGQRHNPQSQSDPKNVDTVHDGFPIQR